MSATTGIVSAVYVATTDSEKHKWRVHPYPAKGKKSALSEYEQRRRLRPKSKADNAMDAAKQRALEYLRKNKPSDEPNGKRND